MRPFKSELLDQEMRDLLRHFLGSTRPSVVVLAALSLSFLGWFADSLYGAVDSHLRWWLTGARPPAGGLWTLLLAGPFLLVLIVLIVKAKKARRRHDFRVVGSSDPHGVRALVVFLSEPEAELLPHDLELGGRLDEASTRAQIRGKWRMPAEAVAFHAFAPDSVLRDLIIVGSSGVKGSQPRAADFRRWLERLWPAGGRDVRLRLLEELLPEDVPAGVDVDDLESLVQVFDEIYRRLEHEGVSRHRVVIDITSGTKLVTAAGVAVALAEGRRFQYVDRGYAVTLFDPTYQPREAAA